MTQQKSCALQVIIQCPNLEKLDTQGCIGLQTLMLWTDKLTELDITDAKVGHIQRSYLRNSVRHAFACFHLRDDGDMLNGKCDSKLKILVMCQMLPTSQHCHPMGGDLSTPTSVIATTLQSRFSFVLMHATHSVRHWMHESLQSQTCSE